MDRAIGQKTRTLRCGTIYERLFLTVENKGGYQMKCPRCEGLMVRDHFYDPDGPFLRIETLRCLNCGETVYPKAAKQSAGLGSRKPASQAA